MGKFSQPQATIGSFLTPECLEYLSEFLGYHPATFENHFLKGILLRERNTYTEKEKRLLNLLGRYLETIPLINGLLPLDDERFGRYMKFIADFLDREPEGIPVRFNEFV